MKAMGDTVKAVVSGLAMSVALYSGVGAAVAGPDVKQLPVLAGADAVLYEVTENMYLLDSAGNVVTPDKAVSRKADASLYGWARVGNPLCPSELLVTNKKNDTCTVTAVGMDDISLATGTGSVSGTFAVVVQDDNGTDSAEYVVMNGAFLGEMDLSRRPLGKIAGTFTPAGTSYAVPFCGTIRLPFSLEKGKREAPHRSRTSYYLADDFQTLIPIQRSELSLGVPTVRFEVSFQGNCAKY
jgi:hypothetical protein